MAQVLLVDGLKLALEKLESGQPAALLHWSMNLYVNLGTINKKAYAAIRCMSTEKGAGRPSVRVRE
jgi:hypothetical protein